MMTAIRTKCLKTFLCCRDMFFSYTKILVKHPFLESVFVAGK